LKDAQVLEDKRAHLQFIQGAITRMSDASASIKRHAIVVALAVLGSAQLSHQKILVVAGIAITLVFALLDASYLRRERGFRLLYDEVRTEPADKVVDFRMNPLINSHSLRNALFSWSVGGLYISLAAVQLVAIFRFSF
jgi:hypothetical protein